MESQTTGGRLLNRNFTAFILERSSFNSAWNVAQVCLTWFIFESTGSAVDVGFVAIVESLAALIISLPAGAMVDRLNRGKILFGSAMLGFVAFALLIVVIISISFNLYVLLGIVAVWGLSREFSRSTTLSALPDLVREEFMGRANGIFRATTSTVASVSSAAAGGIVLTLGVVAGFEYVAGAYLACGILAVLFVLPVLTAVQERRNTQVDPKSSIFSDLREGFSWLVRRRGFFMLTVSATFSNFFFDMTVTFMVVYVASGIHATSLIYGLVLAGFAAGDVSGSLLSGRMSLLKHAGKMNILTFMAVPGLCVLFMGIFPSSVTALALTFALGMCIGIAANVWLTSAHNVVPPDLRGKYFAIDGVLSSISPVAIAAGAFVISQIGITEDFILSGIGLLICALAFSLMKSLWMLDCRKEVQGKPGIFN